MQNLHRLDVKTMKTKLKLNYKSDQIIMHASIWRQNDLKQNYKTYQFTSWDWMSKRQNKAKLQKWSNYNELHRFDVKTILMLSYVAKHSKQRKTTKVIKLQWIASICQNIKTKVIKNVELRRETFKTTQNYKKSQTQRKTTKPIKLQWIASSIKTKLKLNYKSNQNSMTCIDWMSKRQN